MFGIGMTELMVVLVIGLLVIGPKKLPGLARSLGKSLAEFRRASDDVRREFLDVTRSAQIDPAPEDRPADSDEQVSPPTTEESTVDDSGTDSGTDPGTDPGTKADSTPTDAKSDTTAKVHHGG